MHIHIYILFIGSEGPMIHIGCMIGAGVSQFQSNYLISLFVGPVGPMIYIGSMIGAGVS